MIDNEDQKSGVANDTEEAEASPTDQKTTDDTSESLSVQGEEYEPSQDGAIQQSDSNSDDNKNDTRVHNNEEKLKFAGPPDLPDVVKAIEHHAAGLDGILTWKEELKLLYLDAVIQQPYYELWRTEANDWFRQSVILKSRKTRLKKKGGV